MGWEALKRELCGKADKAYAAFSLRLTPTRYPMLGVRLPEIRKIAKSVPADEIESVLGKATFSDFESVMLYGFLTGRITEKERLFYRIDRFLEAADNWSHIDSVVASLKGIKKHRKEFLERYSGLTAHEGVFYRRFLVVALMDYFFDGEYEREAIRLYKATCSGDYYVDMALGWGLSVLLIRDFGRAFSLLCGGDFSPSVVYKAARKGIESLRVSDQNKEKLRQFLLNRHK